MSGFQLCGHYILSAPHLISVETFSRVHDGGYVHTGKRKRTFTNLIKRHDKKNCVENSNQVARVV